MLLEERMEKSICFIWNIFHALPEAQQIFQYFIEHLEPGSDIENLF